ncbi:MULTISPECIES: hypothetical protein [Cellulophaga]|uniref:Uncharacterized protein n=2 Tax=Cellulophaga TaxID=104264 RepID=F0RDY2_CELLC|nr:MULTISPECIES: hypothetical protein [Cellulophaga]ADY30937.1 hypothetical protein Celly_3120 [Cellulophaga lytica DSM 7489]AIM61909.1 hypothetical protein IX49_15770 [Cellulophaga lytica]APU11816.1 hypothetical protein A5M85_16465 [Cellulophaga lytica]EWH13449.1 hypothetical protein KLA_09974 [Cellulophaga geojensis KL-A]MDO6852818.1 hypothetical protein [Cellulophaga lytica]
MKQKNKQESTSKMQKMLHLDYRRDDDIWLTNTQTLRRLIGVLGIALPILLFAFLWVTAEHTSTLESISHYYYTRANPIFIIVVSIMAIFLMVYKGREPIDFYISFVAGVFAILLLLFPTDNIAITCCDADAAYSVTYIQDNTWRVRFHYIAAAIFLLSLNYMSLFVFTRSDKPKAERTKEKKQRNTIYKITGAIMFCALLVIMLGLLKVIPEDVYYQNHITFWMETIAIECFGIAWLVKGETIFTD